MEANSEVYSKPCQTSKMTVFCGNGFEFLFLTIFEKKPILDVLQDSLFTSVTGNYLRKKLYLRCGQVLNISLQPLIICEKIHLRCLTGFECVSAIYTTINIRLLPIISYLFTKFHHASNNIVHGETT